MNKKSFIELLAKKLSGQLTAEDAALLDKEMEHNETYRRLASKLSAYLDREKNLEPNIAQLNHTWEMITAAENGTFNGKFDYSTPKPNLFFSTNWFRVAAMLVLFIGAGLLGYQLLNRNADQSLEKVVTADQKKFKMLDDGTKVWLNKHSVIRYNAAFGKHKREIRLEGEAYFDVVKNKKIPLVIHAGTLDIEVKGTAFNVNAYKEHSEIQVALLRGAIQVTDRAHANHQVLLKPNEKLIFSNNVSPQDQNSFLVKSLAPNVLLKDIKWAADTLVFRKEKLKDLVLRMEKKYDLKIEVQSEQLKEKRFSGMFTTETIQQALAALKLSYPLTYTISNRLVVIKD